MVSHGKCSQGDNCKYEHPEVKLPKEERIRWCKQLQANGECQAGSQCKSAHSEEEMRFYHDKYKTYICKPFGQTGSCPNGRFCFAAHGIGELREDASFEKKFRNHWCEAMKKGEKVCTLGKECQGAHNREELLIHNPQYKRFPCATFCVYKVCPLGEFCLNNHGKQDTAVYKTRLCATFEEKGECASGDDCCYAHGEAELRRIPKFKSKFGLKSLWCSVLIKGGTCDFDDCSFAHSKDDLILHNANYKTHLCQSFARSGSCTEGEFCFRAHSQEEWRPPTGFQSGDCPYEAPGRRCIMKDCSLKHLTRPTYTWCTHFATSQSCPRGDECSYAHRKDQLKEDHPGYKTKICVDWMNDECEKGQFCLLTHGVNDIVGEMGPPVTASTAAPVPLMNLKVNGFLLPLSQLESQFPNGAIPTSQPNVVTTVPRSCSPTVREDDSTGKSGDNADCEESLTVVLSAERGKGDGNERRAEGDYDAEGEPPPKKVKLLPGRTDLAPPMTEDELRAVIVSEVDRLYGKVDCESSDPLVLSHQLPAGRMMSSTSMENEMDTYELRKKKKELRLIVKEKEAAAAKVDFADVGAHTTPAYLVYVEALCRYERVRAEIEGGTRESSADNDNGSSDSESNNEDNLVMKRSSSPQSLHQPFLETHCNPLESTSRLTPSLPSEPSPASFSSRIVPTRDSSLPPTSSNISHAFELGEEDYMDVAPLDGQSLSVNEVRDYFAKCGRVIWCFQTSWESSVRVRLFEASLHPILARVNHHIAGKKIAVTLVRTLPFNLPSSVTVPFI